MQAFNCSTPLALAVGQEVVEPAHASDSPEVFRSTSEEECFEATDTERGSECEFFASDAEFYASDEEPPRKRARGGDTSGSVVQKDRAVRDRQQARFLGLNVCKRALAQLLGVGQSTIHSIRQGRPALTNNCRAAPPRHPMFGFVLRGVESLWESVIMYLWFLYNSEAEHMPNEFVLRAELEAPFPDDQQQQADEVTRVLTSMSRLLQTTYTDTDVHLVGPGTFKGPLKALPHSTRTDLYYDYCAYTVSRQLPQASYSTFMRAANKVLKPGIRRFRKQNEHGQCDHCYALRQSISSARTVFQKEEARKEHHRHVLSQWLDRQCFRSLRSMSHSFLHLVDGRPTGLWC